MNQYVSLTAAIAWMTGNESAYTDPNKNLKCLGVHIGLTGPTCSIFHFDYRRDEDGFFEARLAHHEQHYFLPIGEAKEIYKGNFPSEVETMAFAFVEADDLENMSAREITKLLYPELIKKEKEMLVKNTLTYLATAKLTLKTFPSVVDQLNRRSSGFEAITDFESYKEARMQQFKALNVIDR